MKRLTPGFYYTLKKNPLPKGCISNFALSQWLRECSSSLFLLRLTACHLAPPSGCAVVYARIKFNVLYVSRQKLHYNLSDSRRTSKVLFQWLKARMNHCWRSPTLTLLELQSFLSNRLLLPVFLLLLQLFYCCLFVGFLISPPLFHLFPLSDLKNIFGGKKTYRYL